MGYETEKNYGDATMAAVKAFDDFDWSNYEAKDAYIKERGNYIRFSEGVKQFINKKYGGVSEGELHTFIKKCIQEKGVDLSMGTVKGWLSSDEKENEEGNPQGNADSRIRNNIYKLCFALGFTVKETEDFFGRVYLVRPFDSRDIKEAVYLFCMNNNHSYKKALELISIIDSGNNSGHEPDCEMQITKTRVLNLEILKIQNERDFLAFMDANRNSFGIKNNTARQNYTKLLEEAKKMAGVTSNTKLLDIILFGSNVVDMKEKPKATEDLELDIFPLVRRNFPQKQQLNLIEQGKASYDTIRKVLILLKFYTFFMYIGENNADRDREDFYQETNDMLMECGYAPLYPRNPYDWIFMRCAACSHDKNNRGRENNQPLVELTDILIAIQPELD